MIFFKRMWWINGASDNDFNSIGNWSDTEGGASNGEVPNYLTLCLFSDTSSPDNCTLNANSAFARICTVKSHVLEGDDYGHGGTDNYSGIIDLQTYDLEATSYANPVQPVVPGVNDPMFLLGGVDESNKMTLKMGNSAGKGLRCLYSAIFVCNAYVEFDLSDDSIINVAGVYILGNWDIFKTASKGHLIWQGRNFKDVISHDEFSTFAYNNTSAQNKWKKFSTAGYDNPTYTITDGTEKSKVRFQWDKTLVIADEFSWVGGDVRSNVDGQKVSIDLGSEAGSLIASNCYFQDIKVNPNLDAKDNCVDGGNNENIEFHVVPPNSNIIII